MTRRLLPRQDLRSHFHPFIHQTLRRGPGALWMPRDRDPSTGTPSPCRSRRRGSSEVAVPQPNWCRHRRNGHRCRVRGHLLQVWGAAMVCRASAPVREALRRAWSEESVAPSAPKVLASGYAWSAVNFFGECW